MIVNYSIYWNNSYHQLASQHLVNYSFLSSKIKDIFLNHTNIKCMQKSLIYKVYRKENKNAMNISTNIILIFDAI